MSYPQTPFPPPTARVEVKANYLFRHILGTVLAGVAGALGVITALGDFPKTSQQWAGVALPCAAAVVKSVQSYLGASTVGPQ